LRDMAQYFSSLKVPYPAPALTAASVPAALLARGRALTLEGDAARGVPACVSCHGAQLTGVTPNVPGLLGLPLDYLNGQLGAWQSGQRQALSPDCMAKVVKLLNADDLMAVAQYLARQPLPADTSPVSVMALRSSWAQRPASANWVTQASWTCGSAPLNGAQP